VFGGGGGGGADSKAVGNEGNRLESFMARSFGMRIYFTDLSYGILREKVSPSEWAGAIANELHRFFGGQKAPASE
jgi:hypothetical protein